MTEAFAALLIALQVADMWSTHVVLKRGGRELNPLVRALISKVGFVGTTIFKLVLAALIIWIAWPDHWWVLAIACAVYAAVVASNVRLIRRRER